MLIMKIRRMITPVRGGSQAEGKMKDMKKMASLFCSLLFFVLLSGWPVLPAPAADMFEEMSTKDMLYVRGLVGSVSVEKMQVSIRPPKSERIVVTIDPDTVFEGVKGIDDLQKKDQVKVWYLPAGSENRAVKIIKLMDLGC